MSDQRPLTSLQSRRGQQLQQQQIGSSQSQSTFFNRPSTTGGNTQENNDYASRFNSSSSGSNFRTINFTSNQQTQKELGFVGPSNSQIMNSNHNNNSTQQRMPILKQQDSDYQYKDISKTIPKNIYQDKERLYQELIITKKIINTLKFENQKLSTSQYGLKQELKKYEQYDSNDNFQTSSLLNSIKKKPMNRTTGSNFNSEISSIIPTLKKQVAELTVQLKQKEKEMNTIRRNVKLTRIQELEVELKQYQDETTRLRRMLQQSLSLRPQDQDEGDGSVEEKFISQMNQIHNLKGENSKVNETNEELKIKLIEKDKQIKEMERQSQKSAKDKAYYKRLLVEKERELERYRGIDSMSQNNARKSTGLNEGQFKIELEKKIADCNNLNTKLQEKEKKIQELETKIKDLQTDYQEKLSQETKEKDLLRLKNEKEHQELIELKEKYDQLFPIKRNKERKMETTRTQAQGNSAEINSFGPDTPQHRSEFAQTPSQQQARKRLTINNNEIQSLGTELKYRLRHKKIHYSDLDQHLFHHGLVAKQYATFDDMKLVLKADPFYITNEEDLNLLCRYLTEDQTTQTEESIFNDDNNASSNQNKGNRVTSIKNLFKKFIGFYTIYTEETHPEQYHEIQRFVQEKEEQLRQYFCHDNIQYISKSKLESYMRFNDAQIDPVLLDYIYQVSYDKHVFKTFSGYSSPQSKSNHNNNTNKSQSNNLNFDQSLPYTSNVDENTSLSFNQKSNAFNNNNNTGGYIDSIKEDNQLPITKKLTDLTKLHSQEDSCRDSPREDNQNDQLPNIPQSISMNYQASREHNDSDASQLQSNEFQIQTKKNLMPKIDEEEDNGTPQKAVQVIQTINFNNNNNLKNNKESSQFKHDEFFGDTEEVEF